MRHLCFVAVSLLAATIPVCALPGSLPSPTGPFGIGRVTVHWTDAARSEALATDGRNRELMVDVWYPTEAKDGPRAQYVDAPTFERALGDKGLQSLFGKSVAEGIVQGQIQTHAVEGAPFARSLKRSPILIFSHGMGTITQIYTAQFEDLASHGYVIAAITHPYDAFLTVFPDGRWVPFERSHREAAGSSEDQHIAYENTRVEWWAADIRFVLDELFRQNRARSTETPFAGHLDLKRVGAFGHSVGGRAAARACQLDNRIRACADQDGLARMLPFYLTEQGRGMSQPFMLIGRERTNPPTEAELKRFGRTREQAEAMVAELRARRDSTLAATGPGSYRVVLNFAATQHMSFSDLPMLEATDDAQLETQIRIFRAIQSYTRAFFDKTLRGQASPLLVDGGRQDYVDLVRKLR